MYIPRHFDVTDPAWNHALIRAHSFAVMITADDSPSSRAVGLLPRCYQTIPNHADPSRPVSVLTVEIFAVELVVGFGRCTLAITFNQGVPGSISGRLTADYKD